MADAGAPGQAPRSYRSAPNDGGGERPRPPWGQVRDGASFPRQSPRARRGKRRLEAARPLWVAGPRPCSLFLRTTGEGRACAPRHLRGPSSSAISREAMAWAYMCQDRTVGRGGSGRASAKPSLSAPLSSLRQRIRRGFFDVQRSAIGSFRALLTPALTPAMRRASECRSARPCASSQGRGNGRTA